jgi:hypothetical protein
MGQRLRQGLVPYAKLFRIHAEDHEDWPKACLRFAARNLICAPVVQAYDHGELMFAEVERLVRA